MSACFTDQRDLPNTDFLGLARFLGASIAREDLRSLSLDMPDRTRQNPDDAALWINLSIVMQCIGQRDLGLSIQALALQQKRIYRDASVEQPAGLRLLVLSIAGDISANALLDCRMEHSDVELIFYYVSPGDPFAPPVPEHDALFVAMGKTNRRKATLLFATLDASDSFYRGKVELADRSRMNVAFGLPPPELDARFAAESQQAGISGSAGNWPVGGGRASIYNGLTLAAVKRLASFLEDFRVRAGQIRLPRAVRRSA